ncbi:MAG TPA: hypothetical protein VFR64_02860 [Methylomirabilota bacterium]|nr:hypothetical protein [Methylomirabilota bacterium]
MTKPAILTAGALAINACLGGQTSAQVAPSAAVGERQGVVIAERATLAATVKDIDRSQRLMTLQIREDRTVKLDVPKEVKNFDQINVGDAVEAEFLNAVAIAMRPAGTPAAPTEATTVKVAPRGDLPAGAVVKTKQITATVETIDYDSRTVTLKGPEGETRTIAVDPSVERFRDVKVGDQVVVRHTEALAIIIKRES